jgi:hypothetical protein
MEALTKEQLADYRQQVLGSIAGVYDEVDSLYFYEHNMPKTLDEIERLQATAAGLKQELADQEREKLELVKESQRLRKAIAEDLGFFYEQCGCISDADMQEEIAASADRLGVQMIAPIEPAPVSACPGDCTTCEKGKEVGRG